MGQPNAAYWWLGFPVYELAKPQPKLKCNNLFCNIDSGNGIRDPDVLHTARSI